MAITPVSSFAAMQRHAASVLSELFLLAAVGAFALVATAMAPQITIPDPAVDSTASEAAIPDENTYIIALNITAVADAHGHDSGFKLWHI